MKKRIFGRNEPFYMCNGKSPGHPVTCGQTLELETHERTEKEEKDDIRIELRQPKQPSCHGEACR